MYRLHEKAKKREYGARIREVERGAFTPLVLSTTGGMAQVTWLRCMNLVRTTEIRHQGSAGIPKLHHCSGSSGYSIGDQ